MSCDEVSVEMRQKDVRDPEAVLRRKRQVLIRVALRIDHCRRTRVLIANDVRRVRETFQIELLEEHRALL